MKINPEIKNIEDFTIDDFTLENYQSHPHIKGEVSVEISAIAAIGKNNEIGLNNKLIWKISEDLKNFKNYDGTLSCHGKKDL